MKALIDKSLKAFIGMFAFAALLLVSQRVSAQSFSAQLSDKDIPVSEFNSLNVADDFEVTVTRGAYGVRLTVDKDLSPYVEVYVKSKTLNLIFNEKSVPKELKKIYKGKNALKPIFRAVVYVPELQSVSLSDNATLTALEEFTASQFELNATGKSQVTSLSVSASSAKVNLKKNATAALILKTDRGVEAGVDNSANLKMSFTGKELALNAEGSSVVVVDGPCQSLNLFTSGSSQVTVSSETEKVNLTTEGSSKLVLSGKAREMTVKGSRNSTVDAFNLPVETVDADLSNSSSVTVNVSKYVEVNLVGGSSLYYNGSPEFKIEKIVKSTLAPFGTK